MADKSQIRNEILSGILFRLILEGRGSENHMIDRAVVSAMLAADNIAEKESQ